MIRRTLHTFAAAFTVAMVLTGCKPAEPAPAPGDAPEAAPAPLPTPSPMPSVDNGWQAVVTGTGYALVRKENGQDKLRLACASQPGRLMVWVGSFNPIGSEERLTLGFDDHVFGVVAASTKPGPGVDGEGAIPTAELAHLPTAKTVGASYGAQTLTVDAPDRALANAFVEACKQAAEA
jgi:hypothetical protein